MGSATELALFDHLYTQHINEVDGGTYIIAPGVGDEFTIKMNYLADVDADVEIAFEKLPDSAAIPIEYCVADGDELTPDVWVTLDGLADQLATKMALNANITYVPQDPPLTGVATIRIAAVTSTVEISETVKWRWAYDKAAQEAEDAGEAAITSDDEIDTVLGEASGPEAENRTSYGIRVVLTATQITPGIETATEISSEATEATIALNSETGTLYATLNPAVQTAIYQWQRSDFANGPYSDIAGATGSSYELGNADKDKYIRVVASGNGVASTGRVTSAPFGPIE
jgi:hypothetical protein